MKHTSATALLALKLHEIGKTAKMASESLAAATISVRTFE
jgi:hypothetical protein